MKAGKKEKKQVELVEAWNKEHPIGTKVVVTLSDEIRHTKTRSKAQMLGASGDYPGHTAVIWLEGIAGCYTLERVKPA